MNKGYDDLFIGIWKQALDDDTSYVLRKISSDVREAVGDERFRQNRYIFNEYIDGIKEQIIQKIKQNVYEESKKWPNNSFDFYEKYIAKISNEIIKRMK